MSLEAENNKRIVKNTFMLYIRMGLVMIIPLYATRVVLGVLGEEDYGIYNVVGGVVVMFSFLSRTLASASQRYFAFEIGRGDYDKLNKIFNINLILFAIVIVLILALGKLLKDCFKERYNFNLTPNGAPRVLQLMLYREQKQLKIGLD